MKLREALDAIVGQMEMESVALEMESSPLTSPYAERGPRLVVSNTRKAANALQTGGLGLRVSSK